MISTQARFLAIGLSMFLAAGLAIAMKPHPKPKVEIQRLSLEQMIPQKFDNWSMDTTIKAIAPSPDVQTNLNKIYNQILSRTYIDSSDHRVMLTVTYGSEQTDQLKAHRQEVCYAAQGFEIRNIFKESLNLDGRAVAVTRMYAVSGDRHEPVTYWFTMGDKVVFSRFDRLMVQLKYGLTGQIPDGFLIRVSTLDQDPKHAYGVHLRFINDMIKSMSKKDEQLLIGSPL